MLVHWWDCWLLQSLEHGRQRQCRCQGLHECGSVMFTGNTTRNDEFIVAVGGVITFSSPGACGTRTMNCVNYSDVMYTGDSYFTALGGVMGALFNLRIINANLNNTWKNTKFPARLPFKMLTMT